MTTFWQNRRHARIREMLSSYIDGEVSASEARRVEEHLTGCDECAAELESLRTTTMLLGRMPQLEPPRSYALTGGCGRGCASASPAIFCWVHGRTCDCPGLPRWWWCWWLELCSWRGSGCLVKGELSRQRPRHRQRRHKLPWLPRLPLLLHQRPRLNDLVPYLPRLKLRALRLRSHLHQLWQRQPNLLHRLPRPQLPR